MAYIEAAVLFAEVAILYTGLAAGLAVAVVGSAVAVVPAADARIGVVLVGIATVTELRRAVNALDLALAGFAGAAVAGRPPLALVSTLTAFLDSFVAAEWPVVVVLIV